jgi:osmotically-inducible protein OsmY
MGGSIMKTNDELRTDVEDELEWEPSVDHRRIGVAVDDGIVTLTGDVRSYAEKLKAERAVERVKGVTGIANELAVRPSSERTDSDIALTAVEALRWNTLVPPDRVKVEVANGWLTLTGELDYDYQRRVAERAVRDHHGVKGVSNQITLGSQIAPRDIKRDIEKTFTREAVFDAQNITVDVAGGEVTLRGVVRSWPERHEAEKAAWRASGVTSVRNFVTVSAAA